ncbi:hypothetical protein [Streptomyces venezuelae]|uniref:hypothetical protein n=1 Tax=Streptomyces venezuelae TaxID=54571 RepID=UPI00344AE938
MHRAREKDSDRHVFRHDIGPPHAFSGDLICWKCSAPFGPVRAHTRMGKPVQAQYRLLGGDHDATCPLNPDTVTEHIARGSHGLADMDASGVLRLNLPRRLDEVPPIRETDAASDPGFDVVRHSVTTVRPLLPPAVGTAAKIAQFLQLHDHELEIISRFRVRPHDGRLIPWTDFCYGPLHDSYTQLFARLSATPTLAHPVAVLGTVEHVRQDSNGTPYLLIAANVPTGSGQFHVTIRSGFASLVTSLEAGTNILAVGGWEIFSGGYTPALRLWADEHWQLAFWQDEDDGPAGQPRCPAPVSAEQRALDKWRKPPSDRRRTPRATPPPRPPQPRPETPRQHRPHKDLQVRPSQAPGAVQSTHAAADKGPAATGPAPTERPAPPTAPEEQSAALLPPMPTVPPTPPGPAPAAAEHESVPEKRAVRRRSFVPRFLRRQRRP